MSFHACVPADRHRSCLDHSCKRSGASYSGKNRKDGSATHVIADKGHAMPVLVLTPPQKQEGPQNVPADQHGLSRTGAVPASALQQQPLLDDICNNQSRQQLATKAAAILPPLHQSTTRTHASGLAAHSACRSLACLVLHGLLLNRQRPHGPLNRAHGNMGGLTPLCSAQHGVECDSMWRVLGAATRRTGGGGGYGLHCHVEAMCAGEALCLRLSIAPCMASTWHGPCVQRPPAWRQAGV